MRIIQRHAWAALVAALLAGCSGGGGSSSLPAGANAANITQAHQYQLVKACPDGPGTLYCLAVFRKDMTTGRMFTRDLSTVESSSYYTPAQILAAYGLTVASQSQGVGQTVAVIEIGDNPTLIPDLTYYRRYFGLSCGACTVRKVSQSGSSSALPAASSQTYGESSLDVDVVSTVCRQCNILVVEANVPTSTNATVALEQAEANFAIAVDEAVALGAKYISMSYGWGTEVDATDPHYAHPGVILTAAVGDHGYNLAQPSQPCSYATVVCVGGTSLLPAANARGYTDDVWNDGDINLSGTVEPWATGSSCSTLVAKPSWQTDTGCTRRTSTDVSFSADPLHGILIYDSLLGGFGPGGGTSAASPAIAAIFALDGAASAGESAASTFWLGRGSGLNAVTSGNNIDPGYASCVQAYLCTAGTGTLGTYSAPAGWGTPNGTAAF